VNEVPIGRIAAVEFSTVDKKSAEDETPVRLCNYTDVYYNSVVSEDLDFMNATATTEEIRRFTLRAGDVLVTKDSETPDDIAVAALVDNDLPGVLCGYHLAIIRPNKSKVDPRYLFWALNGLSVREQAAAAATGVTRFGLREDALRRLRVWLPSLKDQHVIAGLLDTETARIDALIEKKRRMVSLLRDAMQARTDELVLGLSVDSSDPSPSGFFPRVPSHWLETQIRHVGVDVQTGPFGSQLHADEYVEGGWPVVNPANLVAGRIVPISSMTISDDKRAELSRHILRRADIVFGRRGEMGRVGLVTEAEAGWICGTGSLRLRLSAAHFSPGYLKLLIESAPSRAYLQTGSIGSTMDNLNEDVVRSMPVLVPPLDEQSEIVKQVSVLRERIAALTALLERQIALLQEHRQALITAAVTGELEIAA